MVTFKLLIRKLKRVIMFGFAGILAGVELLNHNRKKAIIGLLAIVFISVVGGITYALLFPTRLASPDTGPFKSVAEYRQFVKDNPLVTAAEPANAPFTTSSVIQQDKTVLYTFELTAPSIKPQMSKQFAEEYLKALTYSQNKALDWIRQQGVNPDDLRIVWRPSPEEMRGKLLGESTHALPNKNPAEYEQNKISPSPTPTPSTVPTPVGSFLH